jgi:predicted transcriptional regulator
MSSVVVVSTSPDATVAQAARGMHAAGVERLPVIDEDGRLVGIVFIHVDNGVVVLQGRIERRSLLPYVLRAVHGVEGVVRVENRLAYDIDDADTLLRAMAFR